MSLPDETTLGEAREWLRSRFEKGAECPCCRQYVKLYKRKLNAAMACVLCVVYRATRNSRGWIHVPSLLNSVNLQPGVAAAIRGDWAKLRFWGLLEPMPARRKDGSSRVGFHRVTNLGRRFVLGQIAVPRYVYLYNQKPVERHNASIQTITIREALGDRFNYAELMRATPDASVSAAEVP